MPPNKSVGANDQHGSGCRWKQSVEPDEEKSVHVRMLHPATQFASQHEDLLAERSILRLKRRLGSEWRGQKGQELEDQR